MKLYRCPSCSGEIQVKYGFTQSVTCEYCGQTSYIEGERLQGDGMPFVIADYGSCLQVGEQLQIHKQRFEVLGRVRFEYSAGFWDEWWLVELGTEHFYVVQEDENELILFDTYDPIEGNFKDLETVGTWISISKELKAYTIEADKATVTATEGQLPFALKRGTSLTYLDCICNDGTPSSLRHMNASFYWLKGKPFTIHAIQYNKKV